MPNRMSSFRKLSSITHLTESDLSLNGAGDSAIVSIVCVTWLSFVVSSSTDASSKFCIFVGGDSLLAVVSVTVFGTSCTSAGQKMLRFCFPFQI